MDRNAVQASSYQSQAMSLSARRAWIEICRVQSSGQTLDVALRKESVDRNHIMGLTTYGNYRSLSARRAWIEIGVSGRGSALSGSLSARRAWIEMLNHYLAKYAPKSRSPQGERG